MWENDQLFDKRNLYGLNDAKSVFFVFVLFISVSFFSFSPHPYHVSYTEITHNSVSHELTFSVEVFTDDLENAIKLEYKPEKFFLGSDSLSSESESVIREYITSKFTILIDGVVVKNQKFLPTASNPDRTTIYFSLSDLPNFTSLSVFSEILVQIFPDQQNIIDFNSKSGKEKALLTNKNTSVTWIIE